ncbi:hypothetical protein E1B28_009825 [Marasmius oreades]|uniref:Micro-fibrillar-associated protein 1 C-terminal domain-containing protein n=1 Tax=Marasmius oreades TaxID=181124 RepID=A0A9P7RW31_9AGAR|nr:uncharacterized protein E1B28_009825 [Marasmius oreades]KAG7090735.1 hypothetical protein E1B28_009825 [Marasmius oreades]
MSTTVRKSAPRLARPATIYRPGKAPKGADTVVDSDEDEEESQEVQEEDGDVSIGGEQDIVQEEEDDDETMPVRKAPATKVKSMNVALKDVNISKEGKVIVAGKEESGRTAVEEEESDEEDFEEEPEAVESEETDSSEYESETEEQPKVQFRPVFVPKRNRVTQEALADDTEEARQQRELEAEERKKQSHDMVAESIRRELAEQEKEEQIPDVDDTDGLDPEAEFEAWRMRELARIKKEKEEEVRREQEREEVERRRALPEAQRLKEDIEHAQQSRGSKPKGKQKFLQKYWHKGAFHQDEEILKRHDFTEATDSTVDVSMLPKVMQVKNFGKRSRTKYTHLVDQDTTIGNGGFGGAGTIKVGGKTIEGGQGCFLCGGPHLKKDCPQNTGLIMRDKHLDGERPQSSWRDKGNEDPSRNRERRDREWSPGRDRRDQPHSRQGNYRRRSRSRSLSRTPPPRHRDYDRKHGRRRSQNWSPERDGKRRRVEAEARD